MAEVPKQIGELIAKFYQNLDAYHTQYGETEVRVEFINPFIEALGWDVTNKAAIAEAYKDVIHEDAVKVGGATKVPDYSFRIGGTRKFFLEAKRPSVSIKDDTGPAYQLRRYAWSAKLPLSILTNFAEKEMKYTVPGNSAKKQHPTFPSTACHSRMVSQCLPIRWHASSTTRTTRLKNYGKL